jgi:acetylornithine/succinyldiaminopimelate/putrescine aminotransferase
MKKTASKKPERPVIVTTKHRGVFFGFAVDTNGETVFLKRARLCIRWSADIKGFMGLAASGPSATCRIGPPADITLREITAVMEVQPDAVKKWEAQPWA